MSRVTRYLHAQILKKKKTKIVYLSCNLISRYVTSKKTQFRQNSIQDLENVKKKLIKNLQLLKFSNFFFFAAMVHFKLKLFDLAEFMEISTVYMTDIRFLLKSCIRHVYKV